MNFNEVRKMSIPDLLNYKPFRDRYINVYNVCHRSTDGAQHYDRETGFVKKLIMDVKRIADASAISVMSALLDLAYHGLSIEPISKAQAYIVPRAFNLGTKENKKWEQRVILMISAYGELALRVRSGIIKYVDGPYLVYEGDDYSTDDGCPKHSRTHKSDKIIAAWMRITRYDGSTECKEFSMTEIMAYRAKADAEQQNSSAWTGGVNGQPTRGMIEAKVIKHSFATYPRLKLGENTALDADGLAGDLAYAEAMQDMTGGPETTDDEGDYTQDQWHSSDEPPADPPPATKTKAKTPAPSNEIPTFKF